VLLPGRFAAEVERTRMMLASGGLESVPIVEEPEPVEPPEPEPEEDA
jgi:hypothetical protein